MHDGEVGIDAELVRRLVAAQFPTLADRSIREVRPPGTVNATFRLGARHCVRLPRLEQWAGDLDRERHWLPRLAPGLSIRIPEPFGWGHPAHGYPFGWAIYGWIDGQTYADELVDDEHRAAEELARFVTELRRIVPAVDAPAGGRRPLGELDAVTRAAIGSAGDATTAPGCGLGGWHSTRRR